MEHVDLLISATWVLPIEPHAQVLTEHAVAIAQGRIRAVLPTADALQRFTPERHLARPGHALLPGLVNVHTSAATSLLRGASLPGALARETARIERLEQRWIDAEYVRDGTELALADMLTSGTTCFADVHPYPEVVAQCVSQARMRACIGLPVGVFTNWAGSADEALDKGLRLRDDYRADPLISTALAPRGAVNDAMLARLQRIADELELPVVISIAEAVGFSLQRLERLGMLTPLLLAAHLTELAEEELELVSQTGINIAHCSQAHLGLRMGQCPVAELLANDVNVALGSGQPAVGSSLDLFAQLSTSALLANGVAGPATAPLTAHDWLQIATLNGARALGLDSDIGSLQPDKWADLCCVDLRRVHSQPVHDPATQLVLALSREQVSDVWVAGRALVSEGRLTELDAEDLQARAQRWSRRIAAAG